MLSPAAIAGYSNKSNNLQNNPFKANTYGLIHPFTWRGLTRSIRESDRRTGFVTSYKALTERCGLCLHYCSLRSSQFTQFMLKIDVIKQRPLPYSTVYLYEVLDEIQPRFLVAQCKLGKTIVKPHSRIIRKRATIMRTSQYSQSQSSLIDKKWVIAYRQIDMQFMVSLTRDCGNGTLLEWIYLA